MILRLKVSTLHKFLKYIEQARLRYYGDNIYPSCNGDKDFIELVFDEIGFTDKKKKYHEVVSEKDISGMTIRVNYETCEDIKVELDDELIKEGD